MNLRQSLINICDWILDRLPEDQPQAAGNGRQSARKAYQRPQDIAPSYEAWKAYKLGNGERVVAPRGKGGEWSTRLYCERKVATARRHRDGAGPRKQLKAGCRRDRRDRTRRSDMHLAWTEAIAAMEAVINGYNDAYEGVYWPGAKDLIDSIYGEAQYKLYLVRG